MAKQKVDCPTFVLRADEPGAVRAPMTVATELPERGELGRLIREFELHGQEK